jgi:hypothetical protein
MLRVADHTENTSHFIVIQLVRWRADCCLVTSYNIRPLRHSFHCCALEHIYGAVAWQCVDQIRYNIITALDQSVWGSLLKNECNEKGCLTFSGTM